MNFRNIAALGIGLSVFASGNAALSAPGPSETLLLSMKPKHHARKLDLSHPASKPSLDTVIPGVVSIVGIGILAHILSKSITKQNSLEQYQERQDALNKLPARKKNPR